jgi:hypothetical protein
MELRNGRKNQSQFSLHTENQRSILWELYITGLSAMSPLQLNLRARVISVLNASSQSSLPIQKDSSQQWKEGTGGLSVRGVKEVTTEQTTW